MFKVEIDEEKLRANTVTTNQLIQTLKENDCINTGALSDTYHTFDELYDHRAHLFAALIAVNQDTAWKSRKHADGTMFDGMFVVGMSTPRGPITYHCENKYWKHFYCKELEFAPEFDGHTPNDVLYRLCSIIDPEALFDANTREIIVDVVGNGAAEKTSGKSTAMYTFGEAIELAKKGHLVCRENWASHITKMCVAYQKGYPYGIPCNKNTAEAWGMSEGDTFKVNPYLQIQYVDGGHSMWAPTNEDIFATDWMIYNP